MSRLGISVRLEDHLCQIGMWELDALHERLSPAAQRARVANFLACVGQAIIDQDHGGAYHVVRPALCAAIDTEFRDSCVEADTGLPAARLAAAISIAHVAALKLPVVPTMLSGTSSAIEMQWAAARLLIECAVTAMRQAYELLAPYERRDDDALTEAAAR